MSRFASLAAVCGLNLGLILTLPSFAQVAPGLPNFTAYSSYQADTIDLMNNNILVQFPGWQKAGAIPLSFTTFPNNFYMYVSPSNNTWAPPAAYLAISYAPAVDGFGFNPQNTSSSNNVSCGGGIFTSEYLNWVVTAPNGTVHPFPSSFWVDSAKCFHSSATATTTDGSGLTLSINIVGTSPSFVSLYDKAGNSLACSGSLNGCATSPKTFTDRNGNTIVRDVNNSKIIDSLGVTALTWSGTGTSWTDVNGGSPSLTFSTSGTAGTKTNFGCTGINEYTSGSSGTTRTNTLTFADGRTASLTFEATPSNSGFITGRPNLLTLPEGGTVTFTYGGGHNGIDCTYQNVPVLTRTLGNGDVTTYTLTHPRIGSTSNYQALNVVVDPGVNETDYTFTGFTSSGISSTANQLLTEVQRYQGNGSGKTLLATDYYCYNSAPSTCPSLANIPTTVTSGAITRVVIYHLPQGVSNPSLVDTRLDSYGNVTERDAYDFGGSAPVTATSVAYGTCSASCGTSSPTITAIGNNIQDRPGKVVTNQNGNVVAQSNYAYDSHGNLLAAYRWNGSTFLAQTTNNVINSNGTPIKTFDLNNNETDYAYASGNYTGCPTGGCTTYPFPTTITDHATGLASGATWYAVGGAVQVLTDANGNNSTLSYANVANVADPYWRVRISADPYSASTYIAYPDSSAPGQSGYSFPFNGAVSDIGEINTTDAFGRPASSQTYQSQTATNYDTTTTSYGWSGNYRQVQYSEPCSAALNAACPSLSHTILYDPLGRIHSSATTSGPTVTYTYSGANATAVTTPPPSGENSKQVELSRDGLGRLTQACLVGATGTDTCPSGATGLKETTAYTAGAGSTTVTVTRGSETKVFTYDALGRLISKQLPETGTNLWSYYYDTVPGACPNATAKSGKMVCSTDPNGNVTYYVYDSVGRLQGEYAGSASTSTLCRVFAYDSLTYPTAKTPPTGYAATNTLGRMLEAYTTDCAGNIITDEWFAYDKDGRALNQWELTPHSTQYYKSTATFYDNGAVATLALASPSEYTMTFGLEGEGRLSSVTNTTHTKTIVNSAVYYPASNPDGSTIFGTDSDAFTWDTSTGALNQYQFTVGSASMTGALTWNGNGTLKQLAVTDGFNSGGTQTCYFNSSLAAGTGYDDWGRLVGSDCGSGKQGQTFSYDNYDNMKKAVISGRIGLSYSPTYNTANQASTSTYDAAGNVTGDGNFVYGWNEFGKMKWAATSGTPNCTTTGHCITYDAFGRIVETSNGSTFAERWFTQLGETANMSGATLNFAYWPAPHGQELLITGNVGSYYFMHKDWQGSARVVAASTHAVNGEQAWSPYGESYLNFGSVIAKEDEFAEMKENFYAGAVFDTPNREYPIASSRWASVDPAGAGWNGYAYPTNPNTFVDPLGLYLAAPGQCDGPSGDGCGAGGGGGGGDCWDASCGINGVDPSSDCPICTGPYGWLGTAGIAAGWLNVISNPGSLPIPVGSPQFSARSGDGPSPTLLYPGETLANDDPSPDGLPTVVDELWMDFGIAANYVTISAGSHGAKPAYDWSCVGRGGGWASPILGSCQYVCFPDVNPDAWGLLTVRYSTLQTACSNITGKCPFAVFIDGPQPGVNLRTGFTVTSCQQYRP